ncbi:putative 5xTM membrane YitT family protein [Acidovorax sp. 62]|uniref:YitT family protein n=1 Tax=unclassified Acidovorax TaxID=2684926 RepID=UPI000C199884|nr:MULTISPECIES: YitT family protein [unclassified Acidovorax]AYM97095.1 YitT family protein [Acidovorax sp. 1608163]PIF89675.1 putative 5xTM membrane YitT family protein [Acidovorax sp. 62]
MSPAESGIPPAPGPVVSLRHGTYEDAQALFSGTLFVAMALMLFNQAGLLIGSTAGIAFLLHYVTDISFGKLFFVVNLPFYWFAWTRMGREFTLKTFLCVALLSLLTELFPHVMQVSYINPLFASLLGGLLLGTGCLFLARHRSSLGGATIVSLYMQNRYGVRAGKVQLAIDCVVLLLALFVVPLERVFYSVLAAVVMGVFLWISHRPGRYVGG